MKTCSKCKEEKLFSEFCKHSRKRDGYNNQCKSCTRQYYEINKLTILTRQQRYKQENKDKISKNYQDNKIEILIKRKEYYEANKNSILIRTREYQKANTDKINARVTRRNANKIKATPNWLTSEEFEQIQYFYKEAKRLKSETGQEYHVDHIVPLRGKNVCGLHVPWNLQVILASENLKKSNKLLEE